MKVILRVYLKHVCKTFTGPRSASCCLFLVQGQLRDGAVHRCAYNRGHPTSYKQPPPQPPSPPLPSPGGAKKRHLQPVPKSRGQAQMALRPRYCDHRRGYAVEIRSGPLRNELLLQLDCFRRPVVADCSCTRRFRRSKPSESLWNTEANSTVMSVTRPHCYRQTATLSG